MNKTSGLDELVDQYRYAETVSFGGNGLARKPMSAAAAIGLSDAPGRKFYSLLGGPEIDLLIGLDALGLAPNFRRAREAGLLAAVESSEYLVLAGLEAAARGVPFLPTQSGLGTDLLRAGAPFRTFLCPLTGQTLVAAPAINPDLAIIHVNVADVRGNAVIYGDASADFLLARASKRVWVTADAVVEELPRIDRRPHGTFIPRLFVDGVVHSVGGADFTGTFPNYPADFEIALEYQQHATDREWLEKYAHAVVARAAKGLAR
jgi:glutaconate CoA-transferase subunit A